jgi:hypothetical protein
MMLVVSSYTHTHTHTTINMHFSSICYLDMAINKNACYNITLLLILCNTFKLLLNVHQLKRDYALNLSILVSAAQKQKLTRIPLVMANEVGNTKNRSTLLSSSV